MSLRAKVAAPVLTPSDFTQGQLLVAGRRPRWGGRGFEPVMGRETRQQGGELPRDGASFPSVEAVERQRAKDSAEVVDSDEDEGFGSQILIFVDYYKYFWGTTL